MYGIFTYMDGCRAVRPMDPMGKGPWKSRVQKGDLSNPFVEFPGNKHVSIIVHGISIYLNMYIHRYGHIYR